MTKLKGILLITILLITILLAINISVFADKPAPKKHANITGSWRVITKSNGNTFCHVTFDSTSAFFGSYADTYTKFKYEFISAGILQLTDMNENIYFIAIVKADKNKLVFGGLFNVDKKIIFERVN